MAVRTALTMTGLGMWSTFDWAACGLQKRRRSVNRISYRCADDIGCLPPSGHAETLCRCSRSGGNCRTRWPRKPVLATNVVCTSQPLAAQAGLRMLADGGSAVDAAIATAIALTVVEPVSNGIGSDAFAIVWDGRELHGLNASGRSPAAWTPEYFGGKGVPPLGWNSVTVPGAVSAWVGVARQIREAALRPALRAGNLLRPQRLSAVTDDRGAVGGASAAVSSPSPDSPKHSCPAAEHRIPGELVTLPDHAVTLEAIAATHGEAFYRGELAAKLEAHSSANGGAMRAGDLAAHHADWVGTISGGLPRIHGARDTAQRSGHRRLDRPRNSRTLRHGCASSRFRRQRASADRGGEARVRRRAGLRVRHRPHDGEPAESSRSGVPARARGADRSGPGQAGVCRNTARGHGVSHRRGRLGRHGVDDPVELHGFRLRRRGARHRDRATKPRRGFRCAHKDTRTR